jgi:hypothetical protein
VKKAVARKARKKAAGGRPSRLEFKVGRLNPKRSVAPSSGRYATKKVRGPDGTVATVFTVRTDSKTFGSDLRHAFEKSVEKARRENKQKLGVRDYRVHS